MFNHDCSRIADYILRSFLWPCQWPITISIDKFLQITEWSDAHLALGKRDIAFEFNGLWWDALSLFFSGFSHNFSPAACPLRLLCVDLPCTYAIIIWNLFINHCWMLFQNVFLESLEDSLLSNIYLDFCRLCIRWIYTMLLFWIVMVEAFELDLHCVFTCYLEILSNSGIPDAHYHIGQDVALKPGGVIYETGKPYESCWIFDSASYTL